MNKPQAYWINLLLIAVLSCAVLSFTACPGGPNDPTNSGGPNDPNTPSGPDDPNNPNNPNNPGQSSAKAITAFSINGVAATIDEAAKTITITLPYDTSVSSLMPVISVSPGASVYPASGDAVDFSYPLTYYTVSAENGSTVQYTVRVSLAPDTRREGKAITAFSINDVAASIDEAAKTITLTLPADSGSSSAYGTTAITVSEGARVSPDSGESRYFYGDTLYYYTVTAENDTQATYTLRVHIAEKKILSFSLVNGSTRYTASEISQYGYIYFSDGTAYSPQFPWDLDSPYTTEITVSPGATVSPASGEPLNFNESNSVVFTVRGADGSTFDYELSLSFTHGGASMTILTTSIDFSDDIHVSTSGTAIIADADYTGYQWWIGDREAAGTGGVVSDGGRRLELAGLADGTYAVKVMAWKDGAPWMTDIEVVKGGN
jgi:hypothetical protein